MRPFHELIEEYERIAAAGFDAPERTEEERQALAQSMRALTATYAAGAMAMYRVIFDALRGGRRMSWFMEMGKDMARYAAENPPALKPPRVM